MIVIKKLSERIPNMHNEFLENWLKELAQDVEKQGDAIKARQEEYEPQTYDEAIALIKGWKRCVADDYFVHWETPSRDWVLIGRDVAVSDEYTYDACIVSWEKDKWPELWKEMEEDGKGRYLYLTNGKWILNCLFMVRRDSTPGRVVCQAYLSYKDHADWAERLSKKATNVD